MALNSHTPLLLCEGKNDEAFLAWIMEHHRIGAVQTAELGGIDPLPSRIQIRLNEIPGAVPPSKIGLVLDADSNPDARRTSAQNALARVAPNSQHHIYLLPDDHGTGMLEDVYLDACKFSSLSVCASDYVRCALESHPHPFNQAKARYNAYCAIVRPTSHDMRKGLANEELNPNHPALIGLVDFLRNLAR